LHDLVSGHPRGNAHRYDAARVRAVSSADKADLRGDDGGFTTAGHQRWIEPALTAPWIGPFGLPWHKHEATQPVGELGNSRPFGEFLGGLIAAVAEHNQRRLDLLRPAGRNVNDEFAALVTRVVNPGMKPELSVRLARSRRARPELPESRRVPAVARSRVAVRRARR
jgi:hypothetical protein